MHQYLSKQLLMVSCSDGALFTIRFSFLKLFSGFLPYLLRFMAYLSFVQLNLVRVFNLGIILFVVSMLSSYRGVLFFSDIQLFLYFALKLSENFSSNFRSCCYPDLFFLNGNLLPIYLKLSYIQQFSSIYFYFYISIFVLQKVRFLLVELDRSILLLNPRSVSLNL